MDFSDDEEVEEDEEIIFHLWDVNKGIFDAYKILRNYTSGEYYSVDSAILLALIKDLNLPVTKTLDMIPYLHTGYLSMILPTTKDKDDGNNREDSTVED